MSHLWQICCTQVNENTFITCVFESCVLKWLTRMYCETGVGHVCFTRLAKEKTVWNMCVSHLTQMWVNTCVTQVCSYFPSLNMSAFLVKVNHEKRFGRTEFIKNYFQLSYLRTLKGTWRKGDGRNKNNIYEKLTTVHQKMKKRNDFGTWIIPKLNSFLPSN